VRLQATGSALIGYRSYLVERPPVP